MLIHSISSEQWADVRILVQVWFGTYLPLNVSVSFIEPSEWSLKVHFPSSPLPKNQNRRREPQLVHKWQPFPNISSQKQTYGLTIYNFLVLLTIKMKKIIWFCVFYRCKVAKVLWDCLFWVKGEYWVSSSSFIMHMQVFYMAFGSQKHHNILWRCAFLSIFWLVWLEQNDRVFHKRVSSIEGMWEHI